jgi:transcription antitermination factor NusG
MPQPALWYACYTRSRHEKQIDRMLRNRAVESYLPIVRRQRQWKDRKKLVSFAMYPGYVFARFPLDQAQTVLSVPGVVRLVGNNGRPTSISDDEIDNVRRFTEALWSITIEPEEAYLPAAGDRVRISSGPFANVQGTVVGRRGRRRIIVGLALLGIGLEVDFPDVVLGPTA